MTWIDEINLELERAKASHQSGNQGRARTSARRAVGIAIMELEKQLPGKRYGRDFITQLRSLALDPEIPEHVRSAADRLQERVSAEFDSPSKHPIEDAEIILRYIRERLS
jgi:hypothetical protein